MPTSYSTVRFLNYREPRRGLCYPFCTHGDTEVLLALYEMGQSGCCPTSPMSAKSARVRQSSSLTRR